MDRINLTLTSKLLASGLRDSFGSQWETYTGTTNGQLQKRWQEFVFNDDLPALQQQLKQVVGDEKPFRVRYRLLDKERVKTHWVTEFGSPTFDAAGKFVGFDCCTFFDDVCELPAGQVDLAAEVKKRGQLLTILSHELRNPLAAIIHSVEYVSEYHEIPPELIDLHGIIVRQTNQMAEILDKVTDTLRFAGKRIDFRKQPFDLSRMVQEVFASLRSTALDSGQSYEFNQPDHSMWVVGDVGRLMQAITNVIRNAIKYTPENGNVKVDLSQSEEQAIVTVSDSGKGIQPENLDKIFELFYQEKKGTSLGQDGMGVGLFLVNQIVEEHEGTVSASSAGLGLGSEFTIRLALAEKPTEMGK